MTSIISELFTWSTLALAIFDVVVISATLFLVTIAIASIRYAARHGK